MKGFAVGLGDDKSESALKSGAPSNMQAKTALATGQFWRHAGDAAAQSKILTDIDALAAANPANPDLAEALVNMFHVGAADYSVQKRIIDIARTRLTGDPATQLVAEGDALAQMKALEGQPLLVSGRTTANSAFTSENLKGKVILLDFWATWCGPCRELIPGTRALYEELHPKGFEVVGIDGDDSDALVDAFTKENKMPWPELRETSQNGDDPWHPLTKKWNIKSLPAMFLVDKKGILRDVQADDNTAAKVRKLLAE